MRLHVWSVLTRPCSPALRTNASSWGPPRSTRAASRSQPVDTVAEQLHVDGRTHTRYCARHISQRMACWRPELCLWARHQLFKQAVCTHLIVPAQRRYTCSPRLQWCSVMPTEQVHSSVCDVARCRTSTTAAISRLSVRLIRLLCAPEQRHGAIRSPMSVSSCAPQHMRHCRTSGGAGIPLARRLRGRCHVRGRWGSGRSDGRLSRGGGGSRSRDCARGKLHSMNVTLLSRRPTRHGGPSTLATGQG